MIGVSDFILMHGSYNRLISDSVGGKKKNKVQGKFVSCAKCGRTRCTLYGNGEKKLCRECKKKADGK